MSIDIDLSEVARLIDEYDRLDEAYMVALRNVAPAQDLFRPLDDIQVAGYRVGVAFGEATKDRNDPKTCADLVRPGPKIPAPGTELSFVRRLVNEWKLQQSQGGHRG